jgi:nucleoside-diphosphate-sugar epimerase
MRCFVTGGAGFIGSNLVDRLLADGHYVTAYDTFATGQQEFLQSASEHACFRLAHGDVLDQERLAGAMADHDVVFHLAANADVRFGTEHPRKDLGLAPKRRYAGGDRGWVGDSPFIFLDTAKIRSLGWRPTLSIRDGVIRTSPTSSRIPGCWLAPDRKCA